MTDVPIREARIMAVMGDVGRCRVFKHFQIEPGQQELETSEFSGELMGSSQTVTYSWLHS